MTSSWKDYIWGSSKNQKKMNTDEIKAIQNQKNQITPENARQKLDQILAKKKNTLTPSNQIKEKVQTILKDKDLFKSNNIENLIQNTLSKIQREKPIVETIQKFQLRDDNELYIENNMLKKDNLLLKVNFQTKSQDCQNLLKKLKSKTQNMKQTQATFIKEKQQLVDDLKIAKDQISQLEQRQKLLESTLQLNRKFKETLAKRLNENLKQQLTDINHQQLNLLSNQQKDMLDAVDRLKSDFAKEMEQHQSERNSYLMENQLLKQDLQSLVKISNYIKTEQFVPPNFTGQNIRLFESSISFLSNNRVNKKQKQLPNRELYQQIVSFLTQIDGKFKRIITKWNKKLILENQKIIELDAQIDKSNTKISQLNEEISKQKSDNKQKDNNIKQLNQIINRIQSQITQLNNKYQQNQRSSTIFINQLQTSSSNKEKQFKQKQQQFISQLNKAQNQIQNLNDINKKLNSTITKLEQQLSTLKSSYQNLQKQKYQEKTKYLNQINCLKTQSKNIQDKKSQVQRELKQSQQQIRTKNEQIHQLKQTLNQNTNNLKKLKSQHENLSKQHQVIFDELRTLRMKDMRCYLQYFSGNILNNETPQYSQWFVKQLQKNLGRRILSTRFIYKLDLQNQNSFHNYIDGHQNLVMLLKMSNGQTIGAYSQVALKKKTDYDYKPGLILAFKNKKVFHVKKQPSTKYNQTIPKALTWDEYYIIWGNADLRIKSGCRQLFSSYTNSNCSYEERNNPNPSISDLFLTNDRTHDKGVVDYEFFSIIFE